ncbi:isoamyl acetate-hydrolyzing esterase [Entophlyctis sp. JEL0112]|nr:isoamyl acetate-hydrolyzing esterase [Entophlyctis sp. JEL0112]
MAAYDLSQDRILLFGDSITQHSFDPSIEGWGAAVANAYMRKMDVVNRGFGGYNTKWCKQILEDVFQTARPAAMTVGGYTPEIKLMTLFLGANDSVLPEFNPTQYVELSEYKQNLLDMLAIVRRISPTTRVLLITPPPIDPRAWGAKCAAKGRKPDRSEANTRRYRDACLEAFYEAKKTWGASLSMLDSWKVFLGRHGWSGNASGADVQYELQQVEDILSDGLHLSLLGNRLLGEAVLQAIQTAWGTGASAAGVEGGNSEQEDMSWVALEKRVPWHGAIDVDALPQSLFVNARRY